MNPAQRPPTLAHQAPKQRSLVPPLSGEARPPAGPSAELSKLREELESVKNSLAQRESSVAEKLAKFAENMDSVHTLSELLSVRYNPFLEGREADLFRPDADRISGLVRALVRGDDAPDPRSPKPRAQSHDPASNGAPRQPVPHDEPDGSDDAPVDAWLGLPPPTEEDLGTPEVVVDLAPRAAPTRSKAQTAPAERDDSQHTTRSPMQPEPIKIEVPRAVASARDSSFVGAPRPTFMALSWLDEMQEKLAPEAVYLCLDYYRDIGWLDESSYNWLCVLASGSIERDPLATWSNLGLSPRRLTSVHQANLVFLNGLFNERLGPEERRNLRNQVRSDFEEL